MFVIMLVLISTEPYNNNTARKRNDTQSQIVFIGSPILKTSLRYIPF